MSEYVTVVEREEEAADATAVDAMFTAGQTEPSLSVVYVKPWEQTATPQRVPGSFLRGLADIAAGRTVDMDRALSDPPPER